MNLKPWPYQLIGSQLLSSSTRKLLADDMGVGKTNQYLLAIDAQKFGALAVVPPSLKYCLEDECRNKWRPDLKPIVCEGMGLGRFKWPSPGELVICGYNQLPDWLLAPPSSSGYSEHDRTAAAKKRRAELRKQRKQFNAFMDTQEPYGAQTIVIYDEAQALRSRESAQSKKARILSALAHTVWPVTATPMPRGDPFALYDILWACQMEELVFPNFATFKRDAGVMYDAQGKPIGAKPTPAFHRALAPHMIRRMIEEVAPHLPGRRYEVRRAQLSAPQLEALGDVPDIVLSAIRHAQTPQQLAALQLLPEFKRFSERRRDIATALIPAMLEHLDLMEENNKRTLVFSAHTAPIVSLTNRPRTAVIHGNDGGPEHRNRVVAEQDNFDVIGITTRCGGAGLNFPDFDHALFVDLDWDFAQNEQAIRRNYRATSKGEVPKLYTFLTTNTELDRLITSKMLRASLNCAVAIDGNEQAHDDGFALSLLESS